jgi:integrase
MRLPKNVYHRKDGRFEARYSVGKVEGKTKYKSVFGKTLREVLNKLEVAQAAADAAKPSIVSSPLTITDAVKAHLESEKLRLKASTLGVYRRYLDSHISPHFGKTRCDALTAQLSQEFINKLLEANGLAVVTVQSIFMLLKTSVSAATGNAFEVKYPKKAKPTVEFLSVDEQKRIEQAAKKRGNNDYIGILLSLYCGMRIGEVAALRWSDINFECGLLQVNRTMQRIKAKDGSKKTMVVFLPPKSTSSERIIPLQDFMLDLLSNFKATSKTESVLAYRGKYIEPRTLQNRFKKILKAAEVKDICWHSTRHTFSVRMLENGTDVKSLSEILGHSSATVTLNVYSHSSLEHKQKCMNTLEGVYSAG